MSKIVDIFLNVCQLQSNKTAIIYAKEGQIISKTFLELQKDVFATVCYMRKNKIRQGDKILAFCASSYELCVFMWASLLVGASIMYVDIFAKQKSLREIFKEYTPDRILVCNKTKSLRFFFQEFSRIKQVINIDKIPMNSSDSDKIALSQISEDTLALLTMTTGSTGIPKVALRSHQDLMQQLQLIKDNTVLSAQGEMALTTSYIYVFANILCAITTVLPQLNLKKNEKAINQKLALFSHLPITMVITTPDFCFKAENHFPNLKRLYVGGAILNLHEAKRIQTKFAHSENIVIYGSTECSIMCTITLREFISLLSQTGQSPLGYPVKGVDVRLTDENEIIVHSDALLKDYLTEDKSTKTNDANNVLWHHTNDIATKQGDVFYFLGKNKYFVSVNNQKIYSNEIEQRIITTLEEIPKCAVLQHRETVYVFLEGYTKELAEKIAKILSKTYQITNSKVLSIKKIPCDVKHHTKIHYEKLKKRFQHGKI